MSQEIYCLVFCLTGSQIIIQFHIFLLRVSEMWSRALFRSPLPYSVKASLFRRRPTMAATRSFTNTTHLRIRDLTGFWRVIRTNDLITRRKTQFSTDLTIRGYQPPGSWPQRDHRYSCLRTKTGKDESPPGSQEGLHSAPPGCKSQIKAERAEVNSKGKRS